MNNDQNSTNFSFHHILSQYRVAIIKLIKNSHVRFSIPGLTYEIAIKDFLSQPTIDQRLQRLSSIKDDLLTSITAIEELEQEAKEKKQEIDKLSDEVKKLTEDKVTTEKVLHISEDSFARVLSRAVSKGRWRGIFEGIIIGLSTSVVASLIVWYFTKP
jgi:hypothetical protein